MNRAAPLLWLLCIASLTTTARFLLLMSLMTPWTTSFCPPCYYYHSFDHTPQQQEAPRRTYFALSVAQQQPETKKTATEEAYAGVTEAKVVEAAATQRRNSKDRFPHAYIATQTRPNFDILNHRRIGGVGSGSGDSESGHPLIYLDSAASSHQPRQVRQALDDYYNNRHSNVHRGAHTCSREATAAFEAARDKVATFIHANQREEVIFTSGATAAINLVVQSYGRSSHLQAGDEVILTVAEHHSNLVPWQMLAQEKGVVLRFVQLDDKTGGLDLTHLESLLSSEKTKMVAFQHVSNVLGCINPVTEMVTMIREKAHPSCKILLDACQSVPHMSINVQALGVDFLAASGHKMCAPTGIGFLWGKYDVLCDMSPWQGGGEMIDTVTLHHGSTWQLPPGRFEAGTPPIAQAIGLGAAIDYLQEIGMDKINMYEHELGDYLYEQLSAIPGITVLGPNPNHGTTAKRAALAAFCHESVHPSDLSTLLDVEGVAIRAGHHCCQPLHEELGYSHSARASLYFYNTPE
jgi:cysteine desulfurase / selenocysteine lyase